MLDEPHLVAGRWSCWLFGEPRRRDAPSTGEEDRLRVDPGAAFGRGLGESEGDPCELLTGRFVTVAYDRDADYCLLSRDQLGAQPLVYAPVADGILFGEHERDLLEWLPSSPGPDRLALLQWVENGVVPCGRTLYHGVHRLPAGHRLALDGGGARVERWWQLRYEGVEPGDAATLAERVRDAAFAAVARAAAGARHPAVKLSGGLDSAALAAGIAADGFNDGRALALGGAFPGHPVTDERELIEATAHHTRLPLELVTYGGTRSMLAAGLAHIARWRLPPATPNLFLWQPLMERARELDVDVVLDGEGGDELFGLAGYLIADMLRAGRAGAAWSLAGRIPGIGLDPSLRIRLRVLRHYGLRPLVPPTVRARRQKRTAASASSIVPLTDARALVELRLARETDRRDGPTWWRLQAESLIDMRDALDMGAHFRREAAEESLERRHPFLYDVQVIEAILRLPPRVQFDPIRDRPLLRDALRGLIPEAVRTRHEKSHFSPLVLAGMRADEAELIEPLRRAEAPIRGYVERAALDRKLAVAPEERSMLGAGSLWRVAIADRWLEFQAGQA